MAVIGILVAVGVAYFIAYACCVASARADRASEIAWIAYLNSRESKDNKDDATLPD